MESTRTKKEKKKKERKKNTKITHSTPRRKKTKEQIGNSPSTPASGEPCLEAKTFRKEGKEIKQKSA